MINRPKAVPMEELSPIITGLVDSGTDVTITVVGNSMAPMLRSYRDTVTLTKCDPLNLKKGQIPLYMRQNGSYVLHRIVKVNDSTYDMVGDNQTNVEHGIPKQNVLCVVKDFTRKGKTHSCADLSFRIYSFFWIHTRLIRKFILKLRRAVKKILRMLKCKK